MSFGGISYLGILVAALAGWLVGAGWYMALADPWVRAQGRSMDEFKAEIAAHQGASAAWLPYVLAFVAELAMAWGLAGLLGHLGPEQTTIRNGIVSAFFVWLAFVIPTLAVNNMFSLRKPMLSVIDGGHWLAVLLVMGAVVGAFGS